MFAHVYQSVACIKKPKEQGQTIQKRLAICLPQNRIFPVKPFVFQFRSFEGDLLRQHALFCHFAKPLAML